VSCSFRGCFLGGSNDGLIPHRVIARACGGRLTQGESGRSHLYGPSRCGAFGALRFSASSEPPYALPAGLLTRAAMKLMAEAA